MAAIEKSVTHSRFAHTLDRSRHLDRPMVDYMAERETDARLRKKLGCTTEEELLDALGAEFYYLPGRDISQNEGFMPYYRGPQLSSTDSSRTCPFGIGFTRGAFDSKFSVDEAIEAPLAKVTTPKEILEHRWPTRADFDYSPLIEVAEAHKNRVLIGGLWTGILGDAVRLYGYERFLTDMALEPEMVHTLVNKLTDVYLDLNDMIFELLKGRLDIYFFGNDFGSQQSLLISKEMWHEFYFDNIRRLTDLAHSYNVVAMMHSCGAIAELIDPLIDAGVDMLDPVQTTAKGMSPRELAERFGGRVVFHGGIDTQQVLPNGSPEEVEAHVDEVVSTLNGAGGYVASGSQLYGPDIPTENIVAIYRRLGAGNLG